MSNRIFELSEVKSSASEFFITVDLTNWLGSETIANVDFAVIRDSDNTDVTSELTDAGQNAYTATGITPYLKGGVSGESYTFHMVVTTDAGSIEDFLLKFSVSDDTITVNITVEDGTNVTDANSYATVAEVDAYFEMRDNSSWTGSLREKEAAIIKATDYIDSKYRTRWLGTMYSSTQALMWPRSSVYIEGTLWEESTIPTQLIFAVCEAALRALSNDLADDLTAGIKTKTIAGAISTTYAVNSGHKIKKYQVIDQLLSNLISGGGAGGDLTRG